MNNKLKVAGMGILGTVFVGAGTFAFFSAKSEKTLDAAKVGTVAVEAGAELKHEGDLNNLNPGDNDKTVNAKNRKGTDHEFKISVKNTGNKSVMVRNIIEVVAKDSKNNPVALKINKDGQDHQVVLITDAQKSELSVGDTSIAGENRGMKGDPIALTYSKDNKSATFTSEQFALNGTGEGAETEKDVNIDSKSVVYDLGLAKEVTNDLLAGGTIELTIKTQAMQYRNTGDSDWKTIFEETKTVNQQ